MYLVLLCVHHRNFFSYTDDPKFSLKKNYLMGGLLIFPGVFGGQGYVWRPQIGILKLCFKNKSIYDK